MIQLLHVHVTQPRCGRSEAPGPRQAAAFLDLIVRFIREFGENRARMGDSGRGSAGNSPETGLRRLQLPQPGSEAVRICLPKNGNVGDPRDAARK